MKINKTYVIKEIKDWLKSFIIAWISVLIIIQFIEPYKIQGSSMLNNYYDKQIIVIKKINNKLNNWTVVIIQAPYSDLYYIKRIIGRPWDTIKIEKWKVYKLIRNKFIEIKEDYLNVENKNNTKWNFIFNIPKWKYLLFWDNRNHSTDSRSCFTFKCDINHSPYINKENIIWEVVFDLWYFNIKKLKFKHYKDNIDTFPKFFNINNN